jgi:short-subunit dehydrogenase
MQNDFVNGKISVITGASAGIGAAIAKKLAAMGSRCILIARDPSRLKKVQDEIAAAGGKAESHPCDLSDADQIEKLTRTLLQAHARCDILVNNAGIGSFGSPLHLTDLAEWERTIAINLRAPYLLLRAFAPGMIAARSGHIINISSLASKNPVPNAAAYAASKWGLNGMMVSAAEELRQYQVRVSLIAPGSVQTGFGSGLAAQKSSLGAIQPEDIAEIVALLASQADQSFISEVLVRPTLKK